MRESNQIILLTLFFFLTFSSTSSCPKFYFKDTDHYYDLTDISNRVWSQYLDGNQLLPKLELSICGTLPNPCSSNSLSKNSQCDTKNSSRVCMTKEDDHRLNSLCFASADYSKIEELEEGIQFLANGDQLISNGSNIYTHHSVVKVICDKENTREPLIKTVINASAANYVYLDIEFHHQSGCIIKTDHHIPVDKITSLSTGSIMLIIFISLIFFYLIVGVLTGWLCDKQGLDLIPNRGFWLNFVGLVGDGCLYLYSLCRPSRYSQVNMYR